MRRTGSDALLTVYLNDHLAGSTAGLELFKRAAAAQGAQRQELLGLVPDVEQDRTSLLALMRRLGVPVRRSKVVGGWVLEKAARLKSNGRLLRRSPLSDLVELEALVLGVEGKASGFRALRQARDPRLDPGELDRLVARAEQQKGVLERLRLDAAAQALG